MNRRGFPILNQGPEEIPWYRAGGAPAPIAAYKPKGAVNLASSYINIVAPGTHTLTVGSAPGFNGDGWLWSSDWLLSDLVPTLSWSVMFRATSLIAETKYIFGCQTSASQGFWMRNTGPAVGSTQCFNGVAGGYQPNALLSGTYAICGKKIYKNGLTDGPDIGAGGTPPTHSIFIGGLNNAGTPVTGPTQGSMQAIVFYESVLTPAQALAVHTSMMLL